MQPPLTFPWPNPAPQPGPSTQRCSEPAGRESGVGGRWCRSRVGLPVPTHHAGQREGGGAHLGAAGCGQGEGSAQQEGDAAEPQRCRAGREMAEEPRWPCWLVPACAHWAHPAAPAPACARLHPQSLPVPPACTRSSPLTPSTRSPYPPMPSDAAHRGPAWTYRSMAAFRGATQPLPRTLPAGRCGRSQGCPSVLRVWRGAGWCRVVPLVLLREPSVGLSPPCTWGTCNPYVLGLVGLPCSGARGPPCPMHRGVCNPHAPRCLHPPPCTRVHPIPIFDNKANIHVSEL